MSRRKEWVALTLIMLIAAGFRLWKLGSVPSGLSHDEVANWRIARDILEGDHAIYFTAAYGHEPLYQYAQAITVAMFGDHWLGLRWPSVAFSLLGIAATYTLIRYLFGVHVALFSIAWLAVSFWSLFYGRVAYRAILLPFTAALSAYFLFRVICRSSQQAVDLPEDWSSDVLFAGLFLGLSVYTYMAARILPFIFAAIVIYAKLVRPRVSVPWSSIVLVFLVGGLISAPLWIWLGVHPAAEYRVAEVREPLDRLLDGDPSLVSQNVKANLKLFTIEGDPWPRYNVPGRPVFAEPVGAALFLAGLLIALWRWRELPYGFLLIWLFGSLVPSIVTSGAPSSIRDILALVVVFVFPALALVELGRWATSRLANLRLTFRPALSQVLWLLGILSLVLSAFFTARDYFIRWPKNEVVRFDYQRDLTAVAQRLNELPPEAAVAVSGLSVQTMDVPTMELAARREVDDVRLCDTRETLVVAMSPYEDSYLLVPGVVPFDEDLRRQLMSWGASEARGTAFSSYRLSDYSALDQGLAQLQTAVMLPDGTSVGVPVSFSGQLTFLGYRKVDRINPDDAVILLTYWRVEEPPAIQLSVFAHLTDSSGDIVAQDDGLASLSKSWRSGDVIVQKHSLIFPNDLPASNVDTVRVGLYRLPAGDRLRVLDSEYLELFPQARQ